MAPNPTSPAKIQRVRPARREVRPDPAPRSDENCNCATERSLTKRQAFPVAPAAGGGWPAWKRSFRRLLTSHVGGPSHCLLFTQELNQRYVQMILGHDGVRIEVSSNFYLTGDYRLGHREQHELGRLGLRSPVEIDPTEDRPKNWWIEQHPADSAWIAGLVAELIIAVVAFDPYSPVELIMFGKDDPCLTCTWGDRT